MCPRSPPCHRCLAACHVRRHRATPAHSRERTDGGFVTRRTPVRCYRRRQAPKRTPSTGSAPCSRTGRPAPPRGCTCRAGASRIGLAHGRRSGRARRCEARPGRRFCNTWRACVNSPLLLATQALRCRGWRKTSVLAWHPMSCYCHAYMPRLMNLWACFKDCAMRDGQQRICSVCLCASSLPCKGWHRPFLVLTGVHQTRHSRAAASVTGSCAS